jgi:hypothetical protein
MTRVLPIVLAAAVAGGLVGGLIDGLDIEPQGSTKAR